MSLPPWSPAWCPGCNALVIQRVVALLPPPERRSWLESEYLVCPRCEAVTVSLPACTVVRARASLAAIGRTRWNEAGLTELQRAVGLAKGMGEERSDEAVAAIGRVAPQLATVTREAAAAGELSHALLTFGLLIDMLRSGLRGRPRARSRAAESRQLSDLIQELQCSLAGLHGEAEGVTGPEVLAGAADAPGDDQDDPGRPDGDGAGAAGMVLEARESQPSS